MATVSSRHPLNVKQVNVVLLHLKYLDIEPSRVYDTSRTNLGKAVTAMMWSDKAFSIYMGDAGKLAAVDTAADFSDEVLVNRADARGTDPCSDGDTQRTSWLSRAGTSLTDTQVHSVARG
jgi:hypothetical protein